MSHVEHSSLREIVRAAHRWRLLMSNPNASPADQQAFQAWLAADPRHADMYDRAITFNQALGAVSLEDLDKSNLRLSFRERILERYHRVASQFARTSVRLVTGSVAAMALITVVFLNWSVQQQGSPIEEVLYAEAFETGIGGSRVLSLDDGTTVTLGAASAVEIEYTPAARKASLISGAAYFNVTSDPTRPFEVNAGDLTASVLGTAFDVKRLARDIRVAVAEGEVEVSFPFILDSKPTQMTKRRSLKPGQQIAANTEDGLRSIQSIPISVIGSWRDDQLYYDGAPLAELVADANRYSAKKVLIVGDVEAIGRLRIRGGFSAKDIDGMLSTLADIHPLQIDRADPEVIRIRAAGNGNH